MPTTGTMRYLTIGDSTYEVYNTDTEVIQTYAAASGYTNWRPLVVGYSSNSSETTAPTTTTGTTYTFNTIKVKPSNGTIRFGAAALYNGDYTTTISADTLTASRTLTAPNKSGTIALISDIPDVSGYAPLASPTFTGVPTAPTPGQSAGDTEIATVKYVQDAVSGAGTGTVTSVSLSNATNGGLSVSGSPITSSGSITVGHTNVLTSAQTTQAVYPIKIDKNGHISAYGAAVSIPTKTSDLINDSGFVTTDEKLAVAEVTSGTTYYPIVGSGTTAATRQYDTTGFIYVVKTGTSSANGWSSLILGNNNTSGTAGNKQGYLTLYGGNGRTSTLKSGAINNNSEIALPDSSGTLALQEDMIPIGSIPSTYMNILLTTNTADTKNKYYDAQSGLQYYSSYSTGGSQGYAGLVLGNNIASGTAYNARGVIYLYGDSTYSTSISAPDATAARQITLPNKSGTVALTDDIPTITLNGSSTTSPSFYAPTTAGTNGYYLKSNGSGAPTWAAAPTIPSNNVTGSGLNNYLAKWDGANTLSATSLYTTTSYNTQSDLYGTIKLYIGNTGQVDWRGQLVFHDGSSSKTITITPPSLTANRTITLPNKTGTIALTSDIPSISLNGSSTTSASFYAPTSAGTSGQVLTSNGSGAPTWAAATDFQSTTATLTVAGWSSSSQTVSVSEITATSVVIVSPAPASYNDYTSAGIYCSAQGSNTLTFTCTTTPSNAITVNILYR